MIIDEHKTDEGLPDAAARAFCLRMVEGPAVGKTWILTEPVTAIGRGVGCQVRIDDSHVSRIQCELNQEGNALRLRTMGQRNPTYVNDVAREDAILSVGDVISFAGSALILDYGTTSGTGADPKTVDARTTQSFSDAIHLRAEFDSTAYLQKLSLAEELHGLVSLLRSLGRADSLEELVNRLTTHLRERLKANRVWMAWRLAANEDLVLYPPASPEDTRAAPVGVMQDACSSGLGVLLAGIDTQGDSCSMAVPLVHGRDSFGAVALERASAWSEGDLQYLVAVAECCAPLIRGAERLEQLQRDSLMSAASQPFSMSMLGESDTMRALHTEIRRAAVARLNVILQGETGVGKELAARMLHDLSARCSGPYVVVNCAAIPDELFESEVFGHEKGSFTGATRRRKGLFELAQGGTLFLDEIGELSLQNQARLLRAVETGSFRLVGAEKEIKVDVRIVCATNRELLDKGQSHFRTDLYHRLAGVVVRIKPLREHKDDIVALANHFLNQAAPHAATHPRGFTHEAIERLTAYDWPGNIRELRNVVERACYTTQAEHISSRDIHIDAMPTPAMAIAAANGIATFDDIERQHILDILARHGNNAVEAAQALGVSRSTFYYKLARHGIKPRALRK